MRALLGLLALSLVLAGCIGQPTLQTASVGPALHAPPALTSEGAKVAVSGDQTLLTWTGQLTPNNAPVSTPLVASAQDSLSYKVHLPAEAHLLHGWINWTDTSAALFFFLDDKDGPICGAASPEGTTSECFATLYGAQAAARDATLTVSLSGGNAPVAFTLTLLASSLDLPMLGSPAPFGPTAPSVFAPPVVVDPQRHTAEPSIAVTPKGVVYVAAPVDAQSALWRSTDGQKFAFVPIHGQPTDPLSQDPIGGGDADVAVSGENDVYFADQGLGEAVSASHDGGKTFFTQPLGSGVPLTDRQWLVLDGGMNAWLAFNGPNGATVSQTRDGGHAWVALGSMKEDSCFRGNLARAPDGTLYFAGCDANGPGVGVSTDGGLSFTWHAVAKRDGKTNTSFLFPAHIFVVATTDEKGNAYVAWSDEAQNPDDTKAPEGPHGLNVWMASSKDQGKTWSKPQKVNQAPGTYVLPWITAGKEGQVAVSFYGTKFVGHPERVIGEWYPLVAITHDALDANATWQESAASPDLNQYGPVCMRGSGCGNARNLLDFFQIQADKDGLLHMAYVDGTGGGSYVKSTIMYAGQVGGVGIGGPSVDKNGGPKAQPILRLPATP
ncbi:MAG: hypothetical protein QOE90_2795 [Thermoplasmata archaeon]|jgi:hypothetical protein|nr:hypothetical protein [Thermoplasmata archaeon]